MVEIASNRTTFLKMIFNPTLFYFYVLEVADSESEARIYNPCYRFEKKKIRLVVATLRSLLHIL